MFLIVLGVAIVLLLRHFWGIKYPMLDSKCVISLPALHVLLLFICFFLAFTWFETILVEYMYTSNYPKDPEGPLLYVFLLALFGSLIGYPACTIISMMLLYRTFNLEKYKQHDLEKLFGINNYCLTSLLVATAISVLFMEKTVNGLDKIFYEQILFTLIGLVCSVILFYKRSTYKNAFSKIYSSEYSTSIESVIVKGIKKDLPREIRHAEESRLRPAVQEATKRCPYCGEEILAVAKKCRYCGEWLNEKHEEHKEYIKCPVCGEQIEKGLCVCPICHEPIGNCQVESGSSHIVSTPQSLVNNISNHQSTIAQQTTAEPGPNEQQPVETTGVHQSFTPTNPSVDSHGTGASSASFSEKDSSNHGTSPFSKITSKQLWIALAVVVVFIFIATAMYMSIPRCTSYDDFPDESEYSPTNSSYSDNSYDEW